MTTTQLAVGASAKPKPVVKLNLTETKQWKQNNYTHCIKKKDKNPSLEN